MRLLDCFAPLFSYGLLVEDMAGAPASTDELATVHERAHALVDQARRLALAEGKLAADVEMAGFAAVAWFDEIFMRHEDRRGHARPLQMTLFQTGDAASEFFDHLAALDGDAGEVREVFAMALLLGFVGQYYYEQDDSGELGRIKAIHCRSAVMAPAVLRSLQREPITRQPYLVQGAATRHLPKAWVGRRPGLMVSIALVLLVLVAFVAPVFSSATPTQVWYLAGLVVATAGTVGWFGVWAWHGLVVTRAHARMVGVSEPNDGFVDLWTSLTNVAQRTRGAVLHPFRRRREWRQLARHPWLLFLGDSTADVRRLLQMVEARAHGRKGEHASSPWRWWILRSLVAIEPVEALTQSSEDFRSDNSPWPQAWALLARERRKLPLDGMVLCVAARDLLGPATFIDSLAAKLHGLASDATSRLRLQLPIYVVVTGMESLLGYATFKASLPATVLRRALGCRAAWGAAESASTGRMDECFDDLMDRLRSVAIAVLASQKDTHGRREAFGFMQSLAVLRNGLRCLLDRLTSQQVVGGRRLLWCGFYLTGGVQTGAPGGDFVDDLFDRFLPGDSWLARRIT